MGYAVSAPHHADVGGMTPGRCPRDRGSSSKRASCCRRLRLLAPGVRAEDIVAFFILANSRTPREGAGDLRAQIAAHRLADARVDDLVAVWGRRLVQNACGETACPTPSGRPRRDRGGMPDGILRARTPWEGAASRPTTLHIRVGGNLAGDRLAIDSRDRRGRPGNCNCPLGRHPVGGVLRRAGPYRSGIPASSGASRRWQVNRTRRILVQRASPCRRCGGHVETSSRDRGRGNRGARPGRTDDGDGQER